MHFEERCGNLVANFIAPGIFGVDAKLPQDKVESPIGIRGRDFSVRK